MALLHFGFPHVDSIADSTILDHSTKQECDKQLC